MNQLNQDPLHRIQAHDSIVEDVAWNNFDEVVFATVGDDRRLKLWDSRTTQRPTSSIEGHKQEIISVDCSPFDQYLMITGSSDRTVAVWDIS